MKLLTKTKRVQGGTLLKPLTAKRFWKAEGTSTRASSVRRRLREFCPHRHRSLMTAAKCCENMDRNAKRQGRHRFWHAVEILLVPPGARP